MANLLVQTVGQAAAGQTSPASLTFVTANVQTGDLLVVAFRNVGSLNAPTVSDGTNSWTVLDQNIAGNLGGFAYIFAPANLNGTKPTITVTLSGGTGMILALAAYRGPTTIRSATSASITINASGTTPASNSIVDTAGDLVLGFIGVSIGAASNITPGSVGGATPGSLDVVGDGLSSNQFCAIESNLNATGSATDTAAFGVANSSASNVGIAAFFNNAAAGGGSSSWLTVAQANSLRGLRH